MNHPLRSIRLSLVPITFGAEDFALAWLLHVRWAPMALFCRVPALCGEESINSNLQVHQARFDKNLAVCLVVACSGILFVHACIRIAINMLHTRSPITLCNGKRVERDRSHPWPCRICYTVASPVCLQQCQEESRIMNQCSTRALNRTIAIGTTTLTLAIREHDAMTETTLQLANLQQQKFDNPASGIHGRINLVALRIVINAQATHRGRMVSAVMVKKLLFEVLRKMTHHGPVPARTGLLLTNTIKKFHADQFDWTTYDDGRVPLRPVPLQVLDSYVQDLKNHLDLFSMLHWPNQGAKWIDRLVFPSSYSRFTEFYEYI